MLCCNILYKHFHTLPDGCSIKKSVLECTISILRHVRLFDEPLLNHSINDVNRAKKKNKCKLKHTFIVGNSSMLLLCFESANKTSSFIHGTDNYLFHKIFFLARVLLTPFVLPLENSSIFKPWLYACIFRCVNDSYLPKGLELFQ